MKTKKKGKGMIVKRNLTEQGLQEYLAIVNACNAQHWKASMIAGNTALINNGLEVTKTENDIAKLLENSKQNWLSRVLVSCGWSIGIAVEINSKTGEIREKGEPQGIKSEIKIETVDKEK